MSDTIKEAIEAIEEEMVEEVRSIIYAGGPFPATGRHLAQKIIAYLRPIIEAEERERCIRAVQSTGNANDTTLPSYIIRQAIAAIRGED